MNDLLKNLAKLSTREVWGNNPYNGSPEFEGEEVDLEKFAELIVKECVKVGHQAFMNDHSTVPVFPAEQIKSHFGVEE